MNVRTTGISRVANTVISPYFANQRSAQSISRFGDQDIAAVLHQERPPAPCAGVVGDERPERVPQRAEEAGDEQVLQPVPVGPRLATSRPAA